MVLCRETGIFCEPQDYFVILVSKYNFFVSKEKETGKKEPETRPNQAYFRFFATL